MLLYSFDQTPCSTLRRGVPARGVGRRWPGAALFVQPAGSTGSAIRQFAGTESSTRRDRGSSVSHSPAYPTRRCSSRRNASRCSPPSTVIITSPIIQYATVDTVLEAGSVAAIQTDEHTHWYPSLPTAKSSESWSFDPPSDGVLDDVRTLLTAFRRDRRPRLANARRYGPRCS